MQEFMSSPVPFKYNLSIVQGATFNHFFTPLTYEGVPVDWTGWTFKSQARASYLSGSALIAELNVTLATPATSGGYSIGLDAATTRTLPTGSIYYDVIASAGTERHVIQEGKIVVNRTVTTHE